MGIRINSVITLLIPVVLLSSPLYAVDEVVLKDGSILEGEIVRQSETTVTLKGRFGVATFEAHQLKELRQKGEIWTPRRLSTSGESILKKELQPQVDVRARANQRSRLVALRAELTESLAAIESRELQYWTRRSVETVSGPVAGVCRVLRPDGDYGYQDAPPSSPTKDTAVWVYQREKKRDESSSDAKPPVYYWVPLYWCPQRKEWLESPPEFAAFQWEEAQVGRSLQRLLNAADPDNPARMWILGDRWLRAPSTTERDKLTATMKATAKQISKAWGGGTQLYEVFRDSLRIALADDHGKVDLALQRRETLKQLIAELPQNADDPELAGR